MAMRKHTTVYHADVVRLTPFTGEVVFASFKFADQNEDEAVSLHLTPEQVERLAEQCADAVARFRACGALPAPIPAEEVA